MPSWIARTLRTDATVIKWRDPPRLRWLRDHRL